MLHKRKPRFIFNDLFFEMHCLKFVDGTQGLVLKGNDVEEKVGRRIGNKDLLTVINFLRKKDLMVALELPYNEISDCGMLSLACYFKTKPIIKYLNLIGNNLTEKGIQCLADLDYLPLITLRLTGNKIGSEGAKHVYKLLCSNSSLTYLDLSDTHQTLSGIAYVLAGLIPSRGGMNNLKYLDLGRPLPKTYHQTDDAHAAELVSQVLAENTQLKEFHLQQYGFDFRDMEILLSGLLKNSTLICLNLNNNNIGDDGVEFLCQYLKQSPPLECLMIGANNFGNLGATSLSMNLPFSKIKLLDITHNRIADEGMLNIFYTIRKNVKLKTLYLWGNKITCLSFIALKKLFLMKILKEEDTDIKLFCADKTLQASWNSQANRFTHRFYCVSDYGFPQLKNCLKVPPPPIQPPEIYYRFQVDQEKMGLPAADWIKKWPIPKFVDPD